MVYVCTVVYVKTDDLTVSRSSDNFTFDSEDAMRAWVEHHEAIQPGYKYGVSNGRYEEREPIPSYSRRGMPERGA